MSIHRDYRDILEGFARHEVEYLVVGGYAVAFHGSPRYTKALDLWVRPADDNLERLRAALVEFDAPESLLLELERASLNDVLWMGIPPVRVDILKGVPGGDFDRAYATRVSAQWDGVPVSLVSHDELIELKRASGRPQDLVDVDQLILAKST